MRVLFTLRSLDRLGGVQTYSMTVAERLLGIHDIAIMTPRIGDPALSLATRGVRLIRNVPDVDKFEPQIIHAQHRQLALLARAFAPSTPMLFHAHGIIPSDEQPPSIDLGVSEWLAVSEEVAQHLRASGVKESVRVMRNPIDTERFNCRISPSPKPRRALVLGRDLGDEPLVRLQTACQSLGIELRAVGTGRHRWHEDMPKLLNQVDVVFALGRGAIEAMSCGRPTYVYGQHGADGWVSAESMPEIAKHNYSGRRFARQLTSEELANDIQAGYRADVSGELRLIVREHHSVADHVEQLCGIYDQLQLPPNIGPVPSEELALLADRLFDGRHVVSRGRMRRVLRPIYSRARSFLR